MRAGTLRLGVGLCFVVALTGCARKSSEVADSVGSDSLIASNPVEAPTGSLDPQLPYEAAPPLQASSRMEKPRRASLKPKSTSSSEPPPPEYSGPAVPTSQQAPPVGPGVNIQWGSFLHVALADQISSESAHPGDSWNGTLGMEVMVGNHEVFPAGSAVHGTVKSVKPAQAGDRAMLTLEVTSIEVDGRSWPVAAAADPIVAGSPRARNLGAIAGSAAAGALIGSAVGGGKGSVIGGAAGGAAAGGVVARSKGPQVVVKPGARLTFTVSQDVVVRR